MEPLIVVELDELVNGFLYFFNIVGRIEIDVFLFDGAPDIQFH
jgi:hypothetical protein